MSNTDVTESMAELKNKLEAWYAAKRETHLREVAVRTRLRKPKFAAWIAAIDNLADVNGAEGTFVRIQVWCTVRGATLELRRTCGELGARTTHDRARPPVGFVRLLRAVSLWSVMLIIGSQRVFVGRNRG